ncbi:hypothetical protein BDZ91DRAFT_715491 [Kalaharituber pfeilii]|nr:hypothetical protein BDZ91DRAFT_715491 [Kalaharituber pfeilii]
MLQPADDRSAQLHLPVFLSHGRASSELVPFTAVFHLAYIVGNWYLLGVQTFITMTKR